MSEPETLRAIAADAVAGPAVDRFAGPRWKRGLWLAGGALALLLGIVGVFLPLLPTTPFVLVAAFCFSRGSPRCEAWLIGHPRLGPLVRDWRAYHAIPLRAKQIASLMMAIGSAWAWWTLPPRLGWLPALACAAIAAWLWRQPHAAPKALRQRAAAD